MIVDTLKFADKLKAAGFTEPQSRAVVECFHGVDVDLEHVATKTDLIELRTATKADLIELKAATKADLSELKAEILKWMFGQTALIVALIKLL